MNKTILGGLAGGIAFFLLGWLMYGILLPKIMTDCFSMDCSRKEEDMVWWALIASNLIWGYALSLILSWSTTRSFSMGMQKGALIVLIIANVPR